MNIFWTAYSHEERHASISRIQDLIGAYGDITDFHMYSDLSLTLKIEIAEKKIDPLYTELSKVLRLDKFDLLNSSAEKERIVFLNITFSTGKGDLKIVVPAVPG